MYDVKVKGNPPWLPYSAYWYRDHWVDCMPPNEIAERMAMKGQYTINIGTAAAMEGVTHWRETQGTWEA
jgi:aminopeptidase-like protein